MTMVSVGDLARSFLLQGQNAQLKTALQKLSLEVTSGLVADQGKVVSGNFSQLSGIEGSLKTLAAYKISGGLAANYAAAMQTTLNTIDDQAASLAPSLLGIGSGGEAASVGAIADQADSALATALSALNVRSGDRSLFAGEATDSPAAASADTVLTALAAVVSGQTTASGVSAAIRSWFTDPSGFRAVGYLGSDQSASPLPVATGESAKLDTTAMDPAIVDTLTGFAMAAVLGRGVLSGSPAEQGTLANAAGAQLLSSASPRAALEAKIGTVQARISSAATRNGAEASAMDQARATLLAADPYSAATDLQSTQTQLETLYAVTARIAEPLARPVR